MFLDTMSSVQSAMFYKILASTITKHQFIRSLQKTQLQVIPHTELTHIYGIISEAALRGCIRIIMENSDPLWKNRSALDELELHGFHILKPADSPYGAIEWSNCTHPKELK